MKFYLKSSIIRELGLRPVGEIQTRTMSNRAESRTVYSPVALESEHSPFAWPPRGKPRGIMAKRPLRRSGSWNRRKERGKPRGMNPPAIQGRSGRFDVVEISDALPNIVGQIPLEDLDWVVECKNQKLIPNPEHKNGELADEF